MRLGIFSLTFWLVVFSPLWLVFHTGIFAHFIIGFFAFFSLIVGYSGYQPFDGYLVLITSLWSCSFIYSVFVVHNF